MSKEEYTAFKNIDSELISDKELFEGRTMTFIGRSDVIMELMSGNNIYIFHSFAYPDVLFTVE